MIHALQSRCGEMGLQRTKGRSKKTSSEASEGARGEGVAVCMWAVTLKGIITGKHSPVFWGAPTEPAKGKM